MKRRDAIRNSAFLVGCGLSAGTITSLISGCKTEHTEEVVTAFLDKDLYALLGEVVETIIPTTDTPGAKEAGVHTYIDTAAQYFTAEEQGLFKELMSGLAEAGFGSKSSEEKEAMLLALDDVEGDVKPYSLLKGLTCQGYFTSEIGATQALVHEPIPGEFIPCMPLSEVGKAWALR